MPVAEDAHLLFGYISIQNLAGTIQNISGSRIYQIDSPRSNSSAAITALTGDVTATGPGSVAATIANGAVTSAKLNLTTLSTSGVATLGNASSSQHSIQGGQAASVQLSVINNNAAASSGGLGIYVTNTANINSLLYMESGGNQKARIAADGAATLGNTTSTFHTLQGGQAADYQVKISNAAANGSGLRVQSGTNTGATTVQAWFGAGVQVGVLNGAGTATFGAELSGANQIFTIQNGSATASSDVTMRLTTANGDWDFSARRTLGRLDIISPNGTIGTASNAGVFNLGPASPGTTFPGNRIRGVTDGSVMAAGDVGETREGTLTTPTSMAANTWTVLTSVNLPNGRWLLSGLAFTAATGGANAPNIYAGLTSQTSGFTSPSYGVDTTSSPGPVGGVSDVGIGVANLIVNITGLGVGISTPWYLKINPTSFAVLARGRITAVRIA